MMFLSLVALLLGLALPVQADIWRCSLSSGQPLYQNTPCALGATQAPIIVSHPRPPAPVIVVLQPYVLWPVPMLPWSPSRHRMFFHYHPSSFHLHP